MLTRKKDEQVILKKKKSNVPHIHKPILAQIIVGSRSSGTPLPFARARRRHRQVAVHQRPTAPANHVAWAVASTTTVPCVLMT